VTTPPAAVIVAAGYWDTQTGDPNSAPGNGKYRADNWAAPALVAIAAQDKNGYDRHAGLVAIAPGDSVTELASNDSQNMQRWTVTAVTDMGSWVLLGTEVAETGSAFVTPGSNQARLLQALSVSVAPPSDVPAWVAWAPPLNPPDAGGLPYDQAAAIGDAYWDTSPHLAAALMWEAYAAMLPPTPAVASVSTGAQSVAYSPAAPTGDYGLAISRAAWHRSFLGGELVSVPLRKAPPEFAPGVYGWPVWWTVDEVPAP
jgi:hypothetical protein